MEVGICWMGGLVAVFLFVYLVFALFRPEWFA